MSVAPAYELHGISRRFGARWALRGISFTVHPGEVVAVRGHNGSGKSTLLRVLSTALRPSLGTAKVFGFDLTRDASEVRAVSAFLAHDPGNYDDLTARENLRFAAAMRGLSEQGIDAILDRVGLVHVADERARGFSAGMQRRLSLGRLLLGRPQVLLLDEPYNNFDHAGCELLDQLIDETRRAGGAVLLVLHDRRQGEHLISRDIVLAQGALVTGESAESPASALGAARSA